MKHALAFSLSQGIRFDNVSLKFGENAPVLENFSATVPTAGVTCLVGRSGSGKSVLCQLSTQLIRAQSGEVTLLGINVSKLKERQLLGVRKNAPYVTQNPALLDSISVFENLRLVSNDTRRIRKALEDFNLAAYSEKSPHSLSLSVRKCVTVARAAVMQSCLVMFDEPTTGLDENAADAVINAIESLKSPERAVVVVSHDQRLVDRLANHIVELEFGKLLFAGSKPDYDARTKT